MMIFTSCSNNDIKDKTTDPVINTTIGIFDKEADGSYVINSDRGSKYYVTNYQMMLDEGYLPGQRVYAEFTGDIDTRPYVGPIVVQYAYPVLVKEFELLTSSAANDPVELLTVWNSGNYLNIQYLIRTSSTNSHLLHLAVVDDSTASADGYLTLELRHDLNGNTQISNHIGIVSYDISKYVADTSIKGFNIRYNDIDKGEQTTTVDIRRKTSTTEQALTQAPNSEMGSLTLAE